MILLQRKRGALWDIEEKEIIRITVLILEED